jgi:hypothetical protein
MLKTNPSSVLGSAAPAAWLAVFAGAGVAQATVIDPQLFVGPPGTNSPPGGTAIGGESNLLTGNAAGTGFSVGVAGNHTMQSPLLVILGLYPGSAANTSLGFTGCPAAGCPLATVGTYGISQNTAPLSSGQNAYQQNRAHRSRLRAGFRELYELGGNGRRQRVPGSGQLHAGRIRGASLDYRQAGHLA